MVESDTIHQPQETEHNPTLFSSEQIQLPARDEAKAQAPQSRTHADTQSAAPASNSNGNPSSDSHRNAQLYHNNERFTQVPSPFLKQKPNATNQQSVHSGHQHAHHGAMTHQGGSSRSLPMGHRQQPHPAYWQQTPYSQYYYTTPHHPYHTPYSHNYMAHGPPPPTNGRYHTPNSPDYSMLPLNEDGTVCQHCVDQMRYYQNQYQLHPAHVSYHHGGQQHMIYNAANSVHSQHYTSPQYQYSGNSQFNTSGVIHPGARYHSQHQRHQHPHQPMVGPPGLPLTTPYNHQNPVPELYSTPRRHRPNLGGASHLANHANNNLLLQSSPFPKQQTSPAQSDPDHPSLSPGELEDHYKNHHHVVVNAQHQNSGSNNPMYFQTPTHKKLQIEVNSGEKRHSSGQHHVQLPHGVMGGRKDVGFAGRNQQTPTNFMSPRGVGTAHQPRSVDSRTADFASPCARLLDKRLRHHAQATTDSAHKIRRHHSQYPPHQPLGHHPHGSHYGPPPQPQHHHVAPVEQQGTPGQISYESRTRGGLLVQSNKKNLIINNHVSDGVKLKFHEMISESSEKKKDSAIQYHQYPPMYPMTYPVYPPMHGAYPPTYYCNPDHPEEVCQCPDCQACMAQNQKNEQQWQPQDQQQTNMAEPQQNEVPTSHKIRVLPLQKLQNSSSEQVLLTNQNQPGVSESTKIQIIKQGLLQNGQNSSSQAILNSQNQSRAASKRERKSQAKLVQQQKHNMQSIKQNSSDDMPSENVQMNYQVIQLPGNQELCGNSCSQQTDHQNAQLHKSTPSIQLTTTEPQQSSVKQLPCQQKCAEKSSCCSKPSCCSKQPPKSQPSSQAKFTGQGSRFSAYSNSSCKENMNLTKVFLDQTSSQNNTNSLQKKEEILFSGLELSNGKQASLKAETPVKQPDELTKGLHNQQATPQVRPSSSQQGTVTKNVGCRCKKSGCLKLYCECLKAGRVCGEHCSCTCCKNKEGNPEREAFLEQLRTKQELQSQIVNQAMAQGAGEGNRGASSVVTGNLLGQLGPYGIKQISATGVFCRCKKSHCRKGYCECFVAGVPCTERCQCEHCENDKIDCSKHNHGNDGQGNAPAYVNMDSQLKIQPQESTELKQSTCCKAAASSSSSEIKFKTPQQVNPPLNSQTPQHVHQFSQPQIPAQKEKDSDDDAVTSGMPNKKDQSQNSLHQHQSSNNGGMESAQSQSTLIATPMTAQNNILASNDRRQNSRKGQLEYSALKPRDLGQELLNKTNTPRQNNQQSVGSSDKNNGQADLSALAPVVTRSSKRRKMQELEAIK